MKVRISTALAFVVSAAAVAPAVAGSGISASGSLDSLTPVTGVTCQNRANFTFTIGSSLPNVIPVTYELVRSDGTTSAPHVVQVGPVIRQLITDAWTVGGPVNDWEQLVITSPASSSDSSKVAVTTFCRPVVQGPPLELYPLAFGSVSVSPPAEARSECPTTYAFATTIAATAAHPTTTATYAWARSDGTTGQKQTVALNGTTPVTIKDTWLVDHPIPNGWEQVVTSYPFVGQSAQGAFSLQCHEKAP